MTSKTVGITVNELFGMACTGDIRELEEYWNDNGNLNIKYEKFGQCHSLVMGAYRNKQYDTVNWLLEHGTKLNEHEQEEVNDKYYRLVMLEKMQTIVPMK